jgi:hypothetical protein
MTYSDVVFGTTTPGNIPLNRVEACERLKVPKDFDFNTVGRNEMILRETATPRYAYVRIGITVEGKTVDFGFEKVQSTNLAKNLNGCSEAYLIAVTLGIGIDRLLNRENMTNQAEHFIMDALSSAYVESYMEMISSRLAKNKNCAPRFSPGYGDLNLGFQQPMLERLNATSNLGITLNKVMLMTPVKSITAIMGVKNV